MQYQEHEEPRTKVPPIEKFQSYSKGRRCPPGVQMNSGEDPTPLSCAGYELHYRYFNSKGNNGPS